MVCVHHTIWVRNQSRFEKYIPHRMITFPDKRTLLNAYSKRKLTRENDQNNFVQKKKTLVFRKCKCRMVCAHHTIWVRNQVRFEKYIPHKMITFPDKRTLLNAYSKKPWKMKFGPEEKKTFVFRRYKCRMVCAHHTIWVRNQVGFEKYIPHKIITFPTNEHF